jgi:hypothetical protein
MTIMEAISRIDILKPNSYTEKEKILWLSTLDGIIKKEIIDKHEGNEKISFEGYTGDTLTETVLLVPPPYDDIYLKWLEMQMDYTNGEYGKYNNSMAVYNAAYEAYAKYYTRNHMPLSKGNRFIF